ncbi:MAG: hypothetical protein NXI31_06690 [bacterium]|nr:hypothetical protein [bacterium]
MTIDHDKLTRLARMVAGTRPDELMCDQVMDVICAYFEAVESGAQLTPEQQAIARHLEACPECVETFHGLCDACREPGPDDS